MKITFGTSTKKDGQMRLFAGEKATENRLRFFGSIGVNPDCVTSGLLTHSKHVKVVTEKQIGQILTDTDALVTDLPDVCLTVTIADCLPIFFIDKTKDTIGIAHAGWKGVAKNIAGEVIKKMKSEFRSSPEDITATIGPHLKSCHFEVQSDVLAEFSKYPNSIIKRDEKTFIDLQSIVINQLLDAGLQTENVHPAAECTFCNTDYFSFRRDKPEDVESQVAFIELKAKP